MNTEMNEAMKAHKKAHKKALELWSDADDFARDREPFKKSRCLNCGIYFKKHHNWGCSDGESDFECFTVDYINDKRGLDGSTAKELLKAWEATKDIPKESISDAYTYNWFNAYNVLNDYFMHWTTTPELEAAHEWLTAVVYRDKTKTDAAA